MGATDDAVERAARAIAARDTTQGGEPIPWDSWTAASRERFRDDARAALAAAGAGAEVDREGLATLIDPTAFAPSTAEWRAFDWESRKDRAREAADRILAARGDAATPTEVEWGVRYPSGNVDVKPEATARAVAERYADVPNGGAPVLMQRTVSAWREVEGGEQS